MSVITVEGTYRNGEVKLSERPPIKEARVLVTFLPPGTVDLKSRGIDEQQAADLRARLKPFADDWNRAEMDVYDAD